MGERVKLADVKVGDKLVTDSGFTCMPEGIEVEAKADDDGNLYVECEEGAHYLEAQEDDNGEFLVGITRA